MKARVQAEVTEFIVTNFLFGNVDRTPAEDDSLVQSGTIDSTGVLELIEFLESQFGVEVSERETVPANLDSIARLRDFVVRKSAGQPAAG